MLHGRALRYLDEVARQGSIRKAARVLNVSPSAVSRFVLEAEADLGTPIFDRLPRGLRLTTAGEMLLGHVRDTLHAHERLRTQVRGLKGMARGEVTVATMATLAAGPSPPRVDGAAPRDGEGVVAPAGGADDGLVGQRDARRHAHSHRLC